MNNKGFAITTIVYAIVILLVLILFSVTSIVKNRYVDQSEFINDVKDELKNDYTGRGNLLYSTRNSVQCSVET